MSESASNRLSPGDNAPLFCLPNHSGQLVCLEQFRGSGVVVYFYPKNMTPGCSVEASDFNQLRGEFLAAGLRIVGISPDSPASHQRFISALDLGFELLSDPGHEVMAAWGAYGTKLNYGREVVGTIRSTFVVDGELKIVAALYGVKAKGHARRLLELVGSESGTAEG